MMYELLLFVHVGSAMAYFLFHGAVVSVTFALKHETLDGQRQALSDVLDHVYPAGPLVLLTLVLSGLLLGLLGRWWADGWIWISVLALAGLAAPMLVVGKSYLTLRFQAPDDRPSPQEVAAGDAFARLAYHPLMIRHHAKVPMLLTVAGVMVLGAILWLMMFKPF